MHTALCVAGHRRVDEMVQRWNDEEMRPSCVAMASWLFATHAKISDTRARGAMRCNAMQCNESLQLRRASRLDFASMAR